MGLFTLDRLALRRRTALQRNATGVNQA